MNHYEHSVVFIIIETSAGHCYIEFKSIDCDDLGNDGYVYHRIGSHVADRFWHDK
jgi:hypothetical protein